MAVGDISFALLLGKVKNLAFVTTLVSYLLRSSYERDWVAIRVWGIRQFSLLVVAKIPESFSFDTFFLDFCEISNYI